MDAPVDAAAQEGAVVAKKRKSGIPTGNAGEYFVMGELLRRGFDAQLADRNTQDYDVLVGRTSDSALAKVQIKTVRSAPWYVKVIDFEDGMLDRVTIYVLLGPVDASKSVRYFIAKNRDLAHHLHRPKGWSSNGFMPVRAVTPFEGKWEVLDLLRSQSSVAQ